LLSSSILHLQEVELARRVRPAQLPTTILCKRCGYFTDNQLMTEAEVRIRDDIDFSKFKRILIKVGTSVVVSQSDHTAALERLASTVEQIAELKLRGKEIILVSSGAIGLGSKALERRPGVHRNLTAGLNGSENAEKRACAAIGQARLMSLYELLFNHKNVACSQILLTNQDLKQEQLSRLAETCNLLLDMDVVPILNENDVTNIKEPQSSESLQSNDKSIISDNDALACRLACNLGVDLVILLTDVDGVFTCPPSMPGARIISSIKQNPCSAVHTTLPDGSSGGTGRGGMAAKISAVSGALDQVGAIIIANGCKHNSILHAASGQTVGTLIAKSLAPRAMIPSARL